jgi:hypothetical protein
MRFQALRRNVDPSMCRASTSNLLRAYRALWKEF